MTEHQGPLPHLGLRYVDAQADSNAMLRAALYAGVIAAVLTSIPIAPVILLALPCAGFLSVLFYRRWRNEAILRPKAGFKLGALAGVFGFVGLLVQTVIGTVTAAGQAELRQTMMDAVQQVQQRTPDPQKRQMLEYAKTPQGLAIMMLLSLAFLAVMFIVLSGAGGAFSASLLRRKGPPQR
jgi:di/tricarboxylate transporter